MSDCQAQISQLQDKLLYLHQQVELLMKAMDKMLGHQKKIDNLVFMVSKKVLNDE